MDRRQRKTREAIFNAFTELLSNKDFNQITVGEIIDKALLPLVEENKNKTTFIPSSSAKTTAIRN